MNIHSLARDDVLKRLVTSEKGLGADEVRRRFVEFGPNELGKARRRPLVSRLVRQSTHFLAILLWVGAFLAFVSDYLRPGEGMLTLGFAIVAVICINAAFTFVQEYRAEKALDALKGLLPFHVRTVRDGSESRVTAREIVPGDVIKLSEGDKIPADARLIEAISLQVNNASLTGEADAVLRDDKSFPGDFIDSPNIVFAGTTVVSGSGTAVVFATGMKTEFGRIAHMTTGMEEGLSPLQKEIVKATRLIALIAAVVGLLFFVVGFSIGKTFWENFIFAIGITVALIPEGMLPTVSLALAMGSQRMAKRMALIKTLSSVETLGSVTVICTDKTGTLTQNKMSVVKVWTPGRAVDSDVRRDGDASFLMKVAYDCNNARFQDGAYRGDPTEVALLRISREALGDTSSLRIAEIPFDSDRKRMTTVNRIDDRVYALTKGALEVLLPLCSRARLRGETVSLGDGLRMEIMEMYYSMTDAGLRVLSFAYKEVTEQDAHREGIKGIEYDMVFAGLMGLEDPPRPEVAEAVSTCRGAGIKVVMITGDGSRTAVAVAREVGLVRGDPVVMEGPECDRMSDREVRRRLTMDEVVCARMTPRHKMRIVTLLKEEGERVAVTGDGVNDAPALKKADIGIAMGIAGTDVAKEAADMILLDDNFASIVSAVEEGRAVYENIRKFITYIFASNIPEAVPYLAYILLGIPLPLTVIQILAVDLGTDMLPALALGAERPTPGIMKQPPRKATQRLLNLPLMSRAYLFLGPIEAAACMFGFFWVLYQGGWSWGTTLHLTDPLYQQATTACLTAIIVTQAANVFVCRSMKESLFTIGVFSNRLILIGVAVEILLQVFIVYHPWGNAIFSTAPLSLSVWLVLIPFAVVLLLAEETRKAVIRRRGLG